MQILKALFNPNTHRKFFLFSLSFISLFLSCQNSNSSTSSSKIIFTMSNCGTLPMYSCNLQSPIAVGGKVDIVATNIETSKKLVLESLNPSILKVAQDTIEGIKAGEVLLAAKASDGTIENILLVRVNNVKSVFALSSESLVFENPTDNFCSVTLKKSASFWIGFVPLNVVDQPLMGRDALTVTITPTSLPLTLKQEGVPYYTGNNLTENGTLNVLSKNLPLFSVNFVLEKE